MAREFTGCYAVRLGGWQPPLHRDSAYHTPPDTVRLDSTTVSGPLNSSGFRLTPHIAVLTRHTVVPAHWRVFGPDSLELHWSSGFAGVSLYLRRVNATLRGHAEAFSDVIPVRVLPDGSEQRVPWPAAPVVLERVECP
jgi:hypothetical protein